MGILDRIIDLQKRGITEQEIFRQMQNEGISPREINEALNQSRIKSAVAHSEETADYNATQGMEQSIMDQQVQEPAGIQQQYPPSNEQYQEYYPQMPQAYPQEYYAPVQSLDTDTISEIAEQVFKEKFSEFEQKTGDLVSFKNDIHEKISDLFERIKRIENTIDRLQQAIIGKIGEFGDSISAVHQDLENLHSTTSKLMNPLIDNYKELRKLAER